MSLKFKIMIFCLIISIFSILVSVFGLSIIRNDFLEQKIDVIRGKSQITSLEIEHRLKNYILDFKFLGLLLKSDNSTVPS